MAIFQAADIVELAMQIEKNGEAFYRAVAAKTESPQVKALFEDLASQEVQHYGTFKSLGQTSWDPSMISPQAWSDYLGYLDATVQSAFFQGEDKSLSLADQVNDKVQAIQMAIGFEKETLLFFHDLREMVPERGRPTVSQIIAEEKEHLKRLAAFLPR